MLTTVYGSIVPDMYRPAMQSLNLNQSIEGMHECFQ